MLNELKNLVIDFTDETKDIFESFIGDLTNMFGYDYDKKQLPPHRPCEINNPWRMWTGPEIFFHVTNDIDLCFSVTTRENRRATVALIHVTATFYQYNDNETENQRGCVMFASETRWDAIMKVVEFMKRPTFCVSCLDVCDEKYCFKCRMTFNLRPCGHCKNHI